MTKKNIPEYLRLHVEEALESATKICASPYTALEKSFAEVAGWGLQVHSTAHGASPKTLATYQSASDRSSRILLRLIDEIKNGESDSPATAHCDRAAAERLAAAIGDVFAELERTQTALWEREAELAAGVPITHRPEDEAHLAVRLEAVLKGGAEAIGCQAAGLYLLDAATTELKLRASWGLPRQRLLNSARSLRDAFADLEAMLGHAVVLEDAQLLPNWRSPEDFPSAICVPVSTSSTPLGTLWFFCNRCRDYTSKQTNLAEIIAGRIVAELERQMLISESLQSRQLERQEHSVARRHQTYLPQLPLPIDNWDVAGWSVPADKFGGDFYDWCVLADGCPALAVCDADGPGFEAFQTATMIYTALKSHAGYAHDSRQMLNRLNETIWSGSEGDQFGSLFYAKLHPESNEFEYSCAGQMLGLFVRGAKVEILSMDSPPIGSGPDYEYSCERQQFGSGDVMIILSSGIWNHYTLADRARLTAAIGKLVTTRHSASAADLVQAIRDHLDSPPSDCPIDDRTVLVIKRRT